MRRSYVLLVAGVLALAGAGAAVTLRPHLRHHAPALTQAALESYTSTILPMLRDGGVVVEQGMKPGVAEFAKATGARTASLAEDASSWAGQLEAVRARVAGVPAPPALTSAKAGFDDALAKYAEAARQFRAAVLTSIAARTPVLDRAFATAKDADRTYDAASAVIQDWRRRLGLGPTADFPSPEGT